MPFLLFKHKKLS